MNQYIVIINGFQMTFEAASLSEATAKGKAYYCRVYNINLKDCPTVITRRLWRDWMIA